MIIYIYISFILLPVFAAWLRVQLRLVLFVSFAWLSRYFTLSHSNFTIQFIQFGSLSLCPWIKFCFVPLSLFPCSLDSKRLGIRLIYILLNPPPRAKRLTPRNLLGTYLEGRLLKFFKLQNLIPISLSPQLATPCRTVKTIIIINRL